MTKMMKKKLEKILYSIVYYLFFTSKRLHIAKTVDL